jgi:hypothetical protein
MKAAGKLVAVMLALPVALAFSYLYAQREPEKSKFYLEDDLDFDVWRIPVVEPYNLITTEGSSRQQFGESRWHFQETDFTNNFNPDSINYQRGFITFHDASQHAYGFCDVKRKKISFCGNYQQFREFIATNKLSDALYSAELVYEGWSETRLLPWAKEILEQRWSSTSKE